MSVLQTSPWDIRIDLLTGQTVSLSPVRNMRYERTSDKLVGNFQFEVLDPYGELIPGQEETPEGVALRPINQMRVQIFYGRELRFTGFVVDRKYNAITRILTVIGTDNAARLGNQEKLTATPSTFLAMVQQFCLETEVPLNIHDDAYDYPLVHAINLDNETRLSAIRRYNMDTNFIYIDISGVMHVRRMFSPDDVGPDHIFSTGNGGTYPLLDLVVNDAQTELIDEVWFQRGGSDVRPFKIRVDQILPDIVRHPDDNLSFVTPGTKTILAIDNQSITEIALAREIATFIYKFNVYNQSNLSKLETGFGFTGEIGQAVEARIISPKRTGPDFVHKFKFIISAIEVTTDEEGLGKMFISSQLRGFGDLMTQKIDDLIQKQRKIYSEKIGTLIGFTARTGEEASVNDTPPNSGLTTVTSIIDQTTGLVPSTVNGRCTVRLDIDGQVLPDLLPSTVIDNNILEAQLTRGIINIQEYEQIKKYRAGIIEKDFQVNTRVLVLDNKFVVPMIVPETGIGTISAGPELEAEIDEVVSFSGAFVIGEARSIKWDFGDNTYKEYERAELGQTTYGLSGNYVATLRVEWKNGVISTAETFVTIKPRYTAFSEQLKQEIYVAHLTGVWAGNP